MKHCIIVKFKKEISIEKREALFPDIEKLFSETLSIDGVHAINLRKNVIDRENRYHLIIEIDMEPAALEAYDVCEPHKRWKKDYGDLLEAKAIIDLE